MNKKSLKRQYRGMKDSRDYWYKQYRILRDEIGVHDTTELDSSHDEIGRLEDELVKQLDFTEEREKQHEVEIKALVSLVQDKEHNRLSLLREVKQLQVSRDLHWQSFSNKQNEYQKLYEAYDDMRSRKAILNKNFDDELKKRGAAEESSKRWFASYNETHKRELELDRQLHNAWKGNKDLREEVDALNVTLADRTKSKRHWYQQHTEATKQAAELRAEVIELENQVETLDNPSLPDEPLFGPDPTR